MACDSLWLVIDIGNTQTVAAVFSKKNLKSSALHTVRFSTHSSMSATQHKELLLQSFKQSVSINDQSIEKVIASSVVPAIDPILRQEWGSRIQFIDHNTPRIFELDIPHPEKMGTDRLVNIAGALSLYSPPFLIVDAGTATTFCLVDSRPAFIGGAITPGLETGWRALLHRASKLSSIDVSKLISEPASAFTSPLGRTTEDQLRSGILVGYENLILGMVEQLSLEAQKNFSFKAPQLILTGGCARYFQSSRRILEVFKLEPELTLLGLMQYGSWA